MNVLAQLQASLTDRYDIEREIGAGGMATVYLARDKRHDRRVALKVLNPELGAVLGVERFLAEIRVTANLQHPNLLPLFDSGEAGGLLFYVMPFVEGESLRARLDREKQLPVDEAVRIAVAIASALDYAHQHGVIHRDLKPENVLMQAGQPVIADFGIALAVSNAGGNRITQTGLSLGTPQYMSPEQATGDRAIDGRTDIYSLGAMTYEMLSGEPPVSGSTSQAIIARLLTDRPRPIRSTRSAVPEYLDAAVARALEKLPADRFGTAREFAEALQGRGVTAGLTGGAAPATTAMRPAATTWRGRARDPVVIALAVVTVTALGGVLALLRRPTPPASLAPIRYVMSATDSTKPSDNFPWPAAISPDGETVVYSVAKSVAGTMLYVLRSNQLEAHPIPGTEGAFQPIFSPDGKWVEFEVNGKERKVRLDGSAPVTISDGAGANGADWSTGDEIILGAWGTFSGLSRVSAAGGTPVEFTHPDTTKGERQHVWPIALPDGKAVVFVVWSGTLASSRLAIASLGDGQAVALDLPGIRPLAVLDDMLVYAQVDGAIMAVGIDARGKRLTSKPIPVHDPVTVPAALNGNSGIFVSRGGALVTSRGGTRGKLVWVSPGGSVQPVVPEPRSFTMPSISPDERRLAVIVTEGQKSDVWIYDLGLSTFSRLTSNEAVNSVHWSADGTRVVFTAAGEKSRSAVWSQLAAGGAPADKLFEQSELMPEATLAPDAKSVVITAYHETTWDIFRVPLDSPKVVRTYIGTKAQELGGAFSPDGKWLTVVSDESGRFEVYVRSYPDPSSRIQVSVSGGTDPLWSKDGTRLYYRAGALLLAARVSMSPSFAVLGRDTVMTSAPMVGSYFARSFDVSRDGRRFLGIVSEKDDFQLVVSPNWMTEFRERVAGITRR
jgi:serine/threonine-protein kinase